MKKEPPPPWIAYPGLHPQEGFWKFGGEPYMNLVFRPFWKTLDDDGKRLYLERWKAPEEWFAELNPECDIDPEIKEFLESLDLEDIDNS